MFSFHFGYRYCRLHACIQTNRPCANLRRKVQQHRWYAKRLPESKFAPTSTFRSAVLDDETKSPAAASGSSASSRNSAKVSYSSTLNLPKTTFPMFIKAGEKRVQHEQLIQQYAQFDQLYTLQRQRLPAHDADTTVNHQPEEFILHDGPPYANGPCHIGHAVNKITKDIYNRYSVITGRKLHYIPGWDCHGLPIEQMANSRMNGKNPTSKLDDITSESTIHQVRAESYKFACESIDRQRGAFRSWAVLADWTADMTLLNKEGTGTYATLTAGYEAMLIDMFYQLYERGIVTRSSMPVYWSPSSRTALAEAELEYNKQHASTAVIVKFKLSHIPAEIEQYLHAKSNVSLLIWTTTPWSLVANQAVCYSQSMQYVVVADPNRINNYFIVAKSCLDFVAKECKWPDSSPTIIAEFAGSGLADATYIHPISAAEHHRQLPLLHATHVTPGKGTGLVHCAPNHGQEDFLTFLEHKRALAPVLINEAGRFENALITGDAACDENLLVLPLDFVGKSVLGNDGLDAVLQHMGACDSLIAVNPRYIHSYPYDWRTKQPVLIRASPQWFFNTRHVSTRALQILERDVRVIPEQLKTKLADMLTQRPYWCISRQRKWGTPIPVFYVDADNNTTPDHTVCTRQSVNHLMKLFLANGRAAHNGSDIWWDASKHEQLLSSDIVERYGAEKVRRGADILDIWFESGSTWRHVLPEKQKPDGKIQQVADLVIEGYDQIGAWFQTSLLLSAALQDCAPYKTVYVHGFVLDEAGRKMSKSVGNVVDPAKLISKHGVDVVRLMVAGHVQPGANLALSASLIDACEEVWRKWRNTMRFLLGNLDGNFRIAVDAVPYSNMPIVDKFMLIQLRKFVTECEENYDGLAANKVFSGLLPFMTTTLSSFYFTTIKDRLYCDEKQSVKRRSAQTVLWHLLWNLNALIAPIVPHMAEECFATYLNEHVNEAADAEVASNFPDWQRDLPFFAQNWHLGGRRRQLLDSVLPALNSSDEIMVESCVQKIINLREDINRNRRDNPLNYGAVIEAPENMRNDDFLFMLNQKSNGDEIGCDELADLLQVSQCDVVRKKSDSHADLHEIVPKTRSCAQSNVHEKEDENSGMSRFNMGMQSASVFKSIDDISVVLFNLDEDQAKGSRCARCRKINAPPNNMVDDNAQKPLADVLCGRCTRVLALM